jgi:flagellar hook-associated protein 3 FlgL
MRVPTLQSARQTFDAITARQSEQARLQSQMASGLRINSPGDDPAGAAQAELARSRLAQIGQERRAIQLAGSLLSAADGALGHGVELLQSAREALIAAGDGAYSRADRQALAAQLRSTRDSLLGLANTPDGAGGFVFGGQGTAAEPLAGGSAPAYAAAAGVQRIGEGGRYAATVDGRAAFMALPQGNGVFVTASVAGNAGSGWIDTGSVGNPALLTGHNYSITVGGAPAAPTYSVSDLTSGAVLASNLPLVAGGAIDVDGQRVRIAGTPAMGDTFTLAPAGQQSVFQTFDDAIALLESPTVTATAYSERLERAHTSLDRALDGMILMRSRVGAELRTVDDGYAAGQDQELSVTQRRSDLEDLDLARGISALQSSQTALDAALRSYASIARTSLFQLMG